MASIRKAVDVTMVERLPTGRWVITGKIVGVGGMVSFESPKPRIVPGDPSVELAATPEEWEAMAKKAHAQGARP
jgi:hypothetical protein